MPPRTSDAQIRLTHAHARLAFITAQGLPPQPGAPLVETLSRTGFIRTLGGADVYLAARARIDGLTRGDLDASVSRGELQVVPAVRGCIYLVAREHVPLALRVADLLSRARNQRDHLKAGIRAGEIDALATAVLDTLRSRGPLGTDGLRKALPEGAVRSLGDAGKKVGISSPLPGALRQLEFAGKVERTLDGGRLDTERYLWRVAPRSPFEGARLPEDPIDLYAQCASIFFRGAGLSTARTFAGWCGISLGEAQQAIDRAPLVPVAVEGAAEGGFMLAELRGLLDRTDAAKDAIAFLPFADNLVALHDGAAAMVDAANWATPVPVWGRGKSDLGAARHMHMRSLVADGRIAGLWEYDPDAKAIVLGWFSGVSNALRTRVQKEAVAIARFLSHDVGHGRSFTLDTDDELRARSRAVRALKQN
jgi:hypothetical protein